MIDRLARKHREEDSPTEEILFRFDHDRGEIQLIEVTESAPDIDRVLPVRFQAEYGEGETHPTAVVLLHPDEWKRMQSGDLSLPSTMGDWEEYETLETE